MHISIRMFILLSSIATISHPTLLNAYYFTVPVNNSTITSWFDHDSVSGTMTKYTGEIFSGTNAAISTCTNGCYDDHNGTDFSGTYGDDVLSVYKGNIEDIWWNNCGGWQMHIWHDDINISTLYSHIATTTTVNINDQVDRTDHVAEVDNTGSCSTNAHLHFGVTDGQSLSTSNRIDPFGWFGTSTDPMTNNLGYLWTTNPPSSLPYVFKSGSITSNETWTKGNVYVIDDGLYVEADLTIEAGTIVKALGEWAELLIFGTLDVRGTENDPVYFTSLRDDTIGGDTNGDGSATSPASEDWMGITSFGVANIEGALIKYGYRNAASDGGILNVSSSTLRDGLIGVVGLNSTSIENSSIIYNDIGVSTFNSLVEIRDSLIAHNDDNINIGFSDLLLTNSKIHDAVDYGLHIYNSTTTITNNEFYQNDTAISLSRVVVNNLSGNSIHTNNNGIINMISTYPVNAENNYWGNASGPSGFGPGTGDSVSDYVDFNPWLTSW